MYLHSSELEKCAHVLHARDFCLRVNLQKTRVHGCAHAIRVILNAGTVHTSIKFKSSCTVCSNTLYYNSSCTEMCEANVST